MICINYDLSKITALILTAVSEPFLYLFEVKNGIFASFCTSGFDIQEITLTFTF